MSVVALNMISCTPWDAKQGVISFVNQIVQVIVCDIRRIPINQITSLIIGASQHSTSINAMEASYSKATGTPEARY